MFIPSRRSMLMSILKFQHPRPMENLQTRAEPSPLNKFGAASNGAEIDDRSHLQRLHLEF